MAIIRLFAAAALVVSLAGCMSIPQSTNPVYPAAPPAPTQPPATPRPLPQLQGTKSSESNADAEIRAFIDEKAKEHNLQPIANPYCAVKAYASSKNVFLDDSKGLAGHTFFQNTIESVITVDPSLTEDFKQFALAHECGHKLILTKGWRFASLIEVEVAADAIAIEILKYVHRQDAILAAAVYFIADSDAGGKTHPNALLRADYLLKSLAK